MKSPRRSCLSIWTRLLSSSERRGAGKCSSGPKGDSEGELIRGVGRSNVGLKAQHLILIRSVEGFAIQPDLEHRPDHEMTRTAFELRLDLCFQLLGTTRCGTKRPFSFFQAEYRRFEPDIPLKKS